MRPTEQVRVVASKVLKELVKYKNKNISMVKQWVTMYLGPAIYVCLDLA